MGKYRVFCNNLHVYTDMPDFKEKFNNRTVHDWYKHDEVSHQPLLDLGEDETFEDFMGDAFQMVESGLSLGYRTKWFNNVAEPMHDAYLYPEDREEIIPLITAPDWKLNCSDWNTRHTS